MTDETQAPMPSDLSLDDVLAEYIAREEAGRPTDRQALLARYPQYAADLREFLDNRDQIQRLAAPIRDPENDSLRSSQLLGKVRYFGDYELLEEIATGGMGIVYRARQVSLNRIVAVKMILKGHWHRKRMSSGFARRRRRLRICITQRLWPFTKWDCMKGSTTSRWSLLMAKAWQSCRASNRYQRGKRRNTSKMQPRRCTMPISKGRCIAI